MAGEVLPIGCPSRAELWRRLQLIKACLNHGRINRAELLSIVDGRDLPSPPREAS